MNYEILISVSLGDNLPLQEEFLSRACKTTAILEAKFNEEVLQSDPILIDSVNPELATELGFRLNKKDFQQFRIERKSIKLQCFVEYSTRPAAEERHFIGYVVLQIRDIQEYSPGSAEPKYRWHVLLNPKYKGSSTKRPQLYLAFMVNKLNEAASDDLMSSSMTSQTSLGGGGGGGGLSLSESHHEYLESAFIRPLLRKEPSPAMSSSVHCFPTSSSSYSATHEFDSNLKVKLKSRTFYVWDENRCREADCTQMYLIQIQIDRPRNLANLLCEKKGKSEDDDKSTEYHFKYTMLGKQIRSASFFDLATAADFRRHRFLFPILTFDGPMLQEYFEAYPTVEIRLCRVRNSVVIGFVTTNLLRLFENSSAAIEGDYMIVPEDESVYVKEPFPVVQLKLAISRMDHHHHQQPTQMPVNTPRTPVLSRRKEWEEEGDQLQRSTPTPTPTEMPFPPPKTTKDSHHQQQKPPIAPLAQQQHQSPKPSLSPPLPATAAAAAATHQQPVNHYYISIDLRTIRLTTAAEQNSTSISPSSSPTNSSSTCQQTVLFQPFYLQFSYAFFGISDYIKTYPAIRFAAAQPLEAITVPHGFCGFNFATTREKLVYTFSTVPFIVTLHLEADDTLLGTAELDLSCLLKKRKKEAGKKEDRGDQGTTDSQNQLGDDQFVNTTVPVEDELNDQICEMQVVMFLQEMTNLSYCADEPNRVEVASRRRSIVPSMPDEDENVSEQLNLVNQSLNDMIIETAHDIELWKEEQMRIFKSRLKLKEHQLLLGNSSKQKAELEARLQNVTERERLLAEREAEVVSRQQELDGRLRRLTSEIESATAEVRLAYEEKASVQRTQLKAAEAEKGRLQERLYLLERRLKERELKIRELEASGKGQAPPPRRALSAQRTSSLTRSAISSTGGGSGGTGNTGNTGTRRIVITRDTSTPPLSKSMIEPSSGKPVFETGTRIGSPASHHRSTSAKPPPPLKTTVKAANHRPISTGQTMIPDPPPPLLKSTTEVQPPTQPLIIEKIKKERQELLKRGVSLKDPLIVEIDKRIRNYRPVNVKRI